MITKFNKYQQLNEANSYVVKVNDKLFGKTGNYKDTLSSFKDAIDKGKEGDEVIMYKTKVKGKEVNDISKKQVIGEKAEKKASNRKGKEFYLETILPVFKAIFKAKKEYKSEKGTNQLNGIYSLSTLKSFMRDKDFTNDDVDQVLYFIKNEKDLKSKLKTISIKSSEYGGTIPHWYWDEYTSLDDAKKEKDRVENQGKDIFSKDVEKRKEKSERTKELTKTRKKSTTKREYKDEEGNIVSFGDFMAQKRKNKKEDK